MSIGIEQLQSATGEQRIALFKEIGSRVDESVLAYLSQLTRDPAESEAVREQSSIALGRVRSDSSRLQLSSLLNSDDPVVRQNAAEGLGEDDSDQSIYWLIDSLTDSVNKVRNVAERSLLKREKRMTAIGVERLLDLLDHPDRLTRSPAARLLGRTRDDRALQPLLAMLRSEEWLARMWAAKGLGDLGNHEALPRLIEVMQQDEKNRVRAAAVEAVSSLRPSNIEELFGQVLAKDDDEGVQKTAQEALLALGFEGEELEYDPFADD